MTRSHGTSLATRSWVPSPAPLFSILVCWHTLSLASPSSARFTPPLYTITASTHYEAGFKHGTVARERILKWYSMSDVQELVNFTKTEQGAQAFAEIRKYSTDRQVDKCFTHSPLHVRARWYFLKPCTPHVRTPPFDL